MKWALVHGSGDKKRIDEAGGHLSMLFRDKEQIPTWISITGSAVTRENQEAIFDADLVVIFISQTSLPWLFQARKCIARADQRVALVFLEKIPHWGQALDNIQFNPEWVITPGQDGLPKPVSAQKDRSDAWYQVSVALSRLRDQRTAELISRLPGDPPGGPKKQQQALFLYHPSEAGDVLDGCRQSFCSSDAKGKYVKQARLEAVWLQFERDHLTEYTLRQFENAAAFVVFASAASLSSRWFRALAKGIRTEQKLVLVLMRTCDYAKALEGCPVTWTILPAGEDGEPVALKESRNADGLLVPAAQVLQEQLRMVEGFASDPKTQMSWTEAAWSLLRREEKSGGDTNIQKSAHTAAFFAAEDAEAAERLRDHLTIALPGANIVWVKGTREGMKPEHEQVGAGFSNILVMYSMDVACSEWWQVVQDRAKTGVYALVVNQRPCSLSEEVLTGNGAETDILPSTSRAIASGKSSPDKDYMVVARLFASRITSPPNTQLNSGRKKLGIICNEADAKLLQPLLDPMMRLLIDAGCLTQDDVLVSWNCYDGSLGTKGRLQAAQAEVVIWAISSGALQDEFVGSAMQHMGNDTQLFVLRVGAMAGWDGWKQGVLQSVPQFTVIPEEEGQPLNARSGDDKAEVINGLTEQLVTIFPPR